MTSKKTIEIQRDHIYRAVVRGKVSVVKAKGQPKDGGRWNVVVLSSDKLHAISPTAFLVECDKKGKPIGEPFQHGTGKAKADKSKVIGMPCNAALNKKKKATSKEKKPSGLDAAVTVLADAKEPLDCKQIVEQMLAKKLWQTKGKTPAATIYAAIIREIANRGEKARFKKIERGKFALAK